MTPADELRSMAKDIARQARTEGEAVAFVAEALRAGLVTDAEAEQLEQLVFDRMPPRVVCAVPHLRLALRPLAYCRPSNDNGRRR